MLIVAVVLVGFGLDRRAADRTGDDADPVANAVAAAVGDSSLPAPATGGDGTGQAGGIAIGGAAAVAGAAGQGTGSTLPAALGLPPATMVSTSVADDQSSGAADAADGVPVPSVDPAPPANTAPTATTSPGVVPCDLSRIVMETETSFDGIEHHSVRCAQNWASWVGTPVPPDDGDSFIAVARWVGTRWELRNLGITEVCAGAAVPDALWGPLGCID